MTTPIRSTPAALTGTVFAVVLTVANGDGGALSTPQHIAAAAALTLLIPFAVYVGAVLRACAVTSTDTWAATTAVAAGTVGACLKLASDAPEIAKTGPGISATGPSPAVLTALADATTILALFPLALFGLAAGIAALRTGALPAWLGIGALAAGGALALNGCLLHTENVPAMLMLALWCLLTSIHLLRAGRRGQVGAAPAGVTSAV